MRKQKVGRRNSRDFCTLWRLLYLEKYKKPFHIKWMLDGSAFKRLMSTYSNKTLGKLIHFAFSDGNPVTNFLKSTGYNITVFEREINKYQHYVDVGGIDETKLDMEVPYWDDVRFSFISSCIRSNGWLSLLQIDYDTESDIIWRLFKEKVRRQDKGFYYKVKIYYKRWKRFNSITRRRMKK